MTHPAKATTTDALTFRHMRAAARIGDVAGLGAGRMVARHHSRIGQAFLSSKD
jgi:hypothetical protein